jgi:hypothetical protein
MVETGEFRRSPSYDNMITRVANEYDTTFKSI